MDAGLVMIPDFLVIGAMKAATTSLHEYLRGHPEVFMPPQKEVDYFSVDAHWERGPDWYRQLFATAPPGSVTGEASPSYSKHPEYPRAAERIARSAPEVKLIYCVREPIARTLSHYRHEVVRGREHRPFAEAIEQDHRYLDASRYGLQLEQYVDRLVPDRIFVVESEHLRGGRTAVMSRLFEFLGVDPAWRGYVDAPELYGTADRLAAPGVLRLLGESRSLAPIRHHLSPRTKRRLRTIGAALVPARTTAAAEPDIEPAVRAWVQDALAEDRHRFAALRRACRS